MNPICVEDGIDSSKEAGKLLISIIAAVAEMERENIRVQTMAGREQKAREGKWNGGFAPYGYRLENGELAQEKRSKNNYRREKIHDPEHAHILSGILKCPCCGKGMYGNIAKAGRKDNKTRYYYYCKNTVNATGHKCTFRRNIEQSQIDDMLAKLITAMTKEGKFKDAIQDKIGATVDTTDLEKQLSVLNASLHQAKTIKTRLEQQMDNLDVTDTHYDKKISDLQRRLDAQYDRIDEVYSECTDAVPIIKEGKEVAQIKGISLDKEKSDEHMVSLEKLSTLETVVLLSQLKQKPDDYINVTIELDDMDITSAETKATYDEIKIVQLWRH